MKLLCEAVQRKPTTRSVRWKKENQRHSCGFQASFLCVAPFFFFAATLINFHFVTSPFLTNRRLCRRYCSVFRWIFFSLPLSRVQQTLVTSSCRSELINSSGSAVELGFCLLLRSTENADKENGGVFFRRRCRDFVPRDFVTSLCAVILSLDSVTSFYSVVQFLCWDR